MRRMFGTVSDMRNFTYKDDSEGDNDETEVSKKKKKKKKKRRGAALGGGIGIGSVVVRLASLQFTS